MSGLGFAHDVEQIVETHATDNGGGDGPDDLFHIPATAEDDRRSKAGLTWTTLCGMRRPPATRFHQPDEQWPDDCAMCNHLAWGEGEDDE